MRENDRSERPQNRTDATFSGRNERPQNRTDATFSGRNERPQNRTDAKPCLSDVYKMSTRAKRRQADVRLSGRSMVEMLGVLAIIGVLSVGAMSGYSKAMTKYKRNKQTEQISLIFNNMIELLHTPNAFTCNAVYECANTSIFWKLGAFPATMQGVTSSGRPDTNSVYDVFNTKYYIYSTRTPSLGVRVNIDGNENGRDSCLNILQTAKAFYQDISDLQFRRGTSEGESWQWFLSGGRGTGSNRLNALDMAEMHQRCEVCDSQSTNCYMNIIFK